jgi:hypothetical protein
MVELNVPGRGPFGVLFRSSSVVQARVRDLQYLDLAARRQAMLVRGMFVHLRQDLSASNIAWIDCPSPLKESDFEIEQNKASDETTYGVATTVQRRLSKIRTDLDSFNDAEAFALMASAYRMTAAQFDGPKQTVDGFPSPQTEERWRFLQIENAMKSRSVVPDERKRTHLEKILAAGEHGAFKIWRLSWFLRLLACTGAALSVAAIGWFLYVARDVSLNPSVIYARAEPYLPDLIKRNVPEFTFGLIGRTILWSLLFAALATVVNVIVGKKQGRNIMRVIRWRDTIRSIVIGIVMSTVGFMIARLHLHVFDRMYIRHGRLDKFPQ